MSYPRTDEEWERLAECIVTRYPSVSPELVGAFTVDATQTIFTWYKGEERSKALYERQYARDRLMELARETGCLVGVYYWEVTNMVTGERLESGKRQESIKSAVQDAKRELRRGFQYFGDNHLVIKVFDKSPDERAGLTLEPVLMESFWVSSNPSDVSAGRPFPETYGDWVSLGMDIKEKDPDIGTIAQVNNALISIADDRPDAEEAKQWLVEKAGELNIG